MRNLLGVSYSPVGRFPNRQGPGTSFFWRALWDCSAADTCEAVIAKNLSDRIGTLLHDGLDEPWLCECNHTGAQNLQSLDGGRLHA